MIRRDPVVTIGVDEDVVAKLRVKLDHPVRAYAVPPRIEVREGVTWVESARMAGKMFEAAGVVWHGYFDDVEEIRRALALSSTPTFPDVRATLPLDDRFVSLAMATRVDRVEEPRSVLRAGEQANVSTPSVAKWGHRHCGDGKARVSRGTDGAFTAEELTLVEPFVEGSSERILLIGEAAWHLVYESDDWRKNVSARVRPLDPPNRRLIARARRIADALALPMVGVDFVVRENDAVLLEINAYPGLDDAPGAVDAFVDAVAAWAVNLETYRHASRARWLAQTHEYREVPAELRAVEALDERGAAIVRRGHLKHRAVQLVMFSSFGDFTSYELAIEEEQVRVARVWFRRTDDLAALRRAPTTAFGRLEPTIETAEAVLAPELAERWSARVSALEAVPRAVTGAIVADGTRCELRVGDGMVSWVASWQREAPPTEWALLHAFAGELVDMVEREVGR